jgi:hypothetical protein
MIDEEAVEALKLAPGWEDSIKRISCTAPQERARDMVEEDNQTELHFSLEKRTSLFQEPRGLAAEASLLIPVLMRTQLFVFHCLSEVRETHFHGWIFIQCLLWEKRRSSMKSDNENV